MAEQLESGIERAVLSKQDVAQVVERLGKQISEDYRDLNPLVIAVLRGAFVFTADLVRAISIPCEVDFMAVSSYGSEASSSGRVRIVKDLESDINGRHVIIAEDIVDTGLTLSKLMAMLEQRGPASLRVCAFVFKDVPGYTPPVSIDDKYVGAHVPNEFIVGYGLDYAERYRNLPYVGILKPEVYQ